MSTLHFRFAVFLLVFGALLPAQTTSSITGRVSASTGQPLSAARVVAQQPDRGLTREARTDDAGRFAFTSLPPGVYDVRAEMSSFRPAQLRVQVNVSGSVVADFSLELGAVEQAVTVSARPTGVSTQTSELSYMVDDVAMRNLPLNGRNYTDLMLLQPGVNPFPHRDGGSAVAHGLAMSVNGQDPRSNQYLLDGTPMNDFTNGPAGSAASTMLGMDTIHEFRVETNAYSAEFGRNAGGQINAISKSGTNAFHGGLFLFHRNDNLDAPNYFDPADAQPEFKRNQFGGTVGGPVRKDRTFFFVGYEALRERLGKTINAVVPDASAHNGLFPDPVSGQLLNVGVNPAVKPYLDEFPLPNGPSRGQGLGLYTFAFGQRLRQDFGQFRFDQNLSGGGQFYARYTVDDADQYLPTDFPQFPRSFLSRNQFLTVGHTHVVSARAINNIRLGFSRTRIGQNVDANTASALPPFVPGQQLPGNIDIGGANRWGPQSSANLRLTQNVFGAEDSLSVIRGRHTLKIGGLVERYRNNMANPTFSLGIHTFADVRAFLENRPLRFIGLGPNGRIDRYWRFTLFGLYVQDDIRVNRRLTLNIGLRYEYATLPVDIYGRDSALPNLLDPAPTVGQLYQNPTAKNLSPRFGFAWDLSGDGRTALRAGYGWFFNTNNQQNLIVTVTNPPATPRLAITAGSTFPVPPFDRGIGNTMRPIEWNIKNPNIHFWNLNLQRQLPLGFAATIGYAGSRGIHLWRNTDINIPEPQVLADGTQFWAAGLPRPNRSFSTIELKRSDGNSWYNAGIIDVRRRFSNGISVQSSYTLSRSIDTTQASTFFSDSTNGNVSAMPEFFGLQYNKGLSDFHAKHNWVLNYTWELPFARQSTGIRRALLSGWQLSGISTLRSGNPLTLFVQQNRSRSQWNPSVGPGIGVDRPSMAPGYTHQSAVTGDPARYFDPRAFVLQPAGTLGNLGRGALIGPNSRSFDFSAMKNFALQRLGESAGLQFRVEVFNLFDRANFGTPNLTAFAGQRDDEPTFTSLGLIRSTVTSARQIQLGVRLSF